MRRGRGRNPYWQEREPLPTLGFVMVGTRSPSKLGITNNNSLDRIDNTRVSFNSAQFWQSAFSGQKAIAWVRRWSLKGIAAVRHDASVRLQCQNSRHSQTACRTGPKLREAFVLCSAPFRGIPLLNLFGAPHW